MHTYTVFSLQYQPYSIPYTPHFFIPAPSPPSGVGVSQMGLGRVLVSWTPPSGEPAVTGYIIYYQRDGGQRLSQSAGPAANNATISGLIINVGVTYSITMVATSSTVPSTETPAQTITIIVMGKYYHLSVL